MENPYKLPFGAEVHLRFQSVAIEEVPSDNPQCTQLKWRTCYMNYISSGPLTWGCGHFFYGLKSMIVL